jgi:hypothetical protein
MDTKYPKVLNLSHGQDAPLFIAQRLKVAVTYFLCIDQTHMRRDRTRMQVMTKLTTPQRPIKSRELPKPLFHDWTRLVLVDWTQPYVRSQHHLYAVP